MKYYKNGKTVIATVGHLELPEITEDEYKTEVETSNIRRENQERVYEKHRPFTLEEVNTMMLKKQINTVEIDDQTSARMLDYYPTFDEVIGQTVTQGFKFTYKRKLFKVIQASLTIQEHYPPDTGTESLYARIDDVHDGDTYDPIPYEGNMALENGKYYTQNGVNYLCNRDTGNPVYNALSELVGLYVEIVE